MKLPESLESIVRMLPELAQMQLHEAWNRDQDSMPGPERAIAPRKGHDPERVRKSLLEFARAIYGMDNHASMRGRTADCDSFDHPKVGPDGEPEWRRPCEHLTRLWDARQEYELACLNAPTDAVACDCHGTGLFYGRGVIENGVFKGTVGKHYACNGKGWQSPADVKRNQYYWNHVARIYL